MNQFIERHVEAAIVAGILAVAAIAGFVFHVIAPMPAHARWKPEYAQIAPETRQWFISQTNPKTGVPCCNNADGINAEEEQCPGGEILMHPEFKCPAGDDNVWVKFVIKSSTPNSPDIAVDWMVVPPDTILPASRGVATVWWYRENGRVMIRCFAKGART
jgi:hypothetical protein